ncbi:MAG: class I SAM-dependent methyltransferase [Cyanobacteriota bacterium]
MLFLKKGVLFLNSKFHFYDFNSQYEWDKIWSREKEQTWRNYEKSFEEVAKRIDSGTKVLDAGCGLGLLLDYLSQQNTCKTIGLDISKVAIDEVKNKGHEGYLSNLPEIPLEDNSVDVVCATELLEHIRFPDDVIKSFKRVCNPQGKIIIVVPNEVLGPLDLSQHYRAYTPENLEEFLNNYFNNVEIVSFEDRGPRILACCINDK